MSFTQKKLSATFTIANGQFEGGGNSLTVSDLRMSADVRVVSGPGNSQLDSLVIYGMSLDHMNRLSLIGKTYNRISEKNTVTVEAGDDETGMSTIFTGKIRTATIDGSEMPNLRFVVTGSPLDAAARKPVAVTSRKGSIAGETLAQSLAQQMGLQFANNGVHVMLSNPYLWGTAVSQLRQLMQAMNCQWLAHNGKLMIWPNGKSGPGDATLFSPENGLVGYPTCSQSLVEITAYYRPEYQPGSPFTVKSSIQAANGKWHFMKLEYGLDSFTPHGRWFMHLLGSAPDETPIGGTSDG